MSVEYKGYGRAEPLLEKRLPAFDNSLTQRMIIEANVIKEQLQRSIIPTEPKSFTIKDAHKETVYWTITFSQPVIQYVPNCFRYITKNILFYFQKGQWLEHIPCYIPNINHVAMYTRYNGGESEYGNNSDGLLSKFVYQNRIPMTLFSYNILLRYDSTKQFLEPFVHDYIKNCFETCYWRLPTPMSQDDGSCINNLIYSTASKIYEILVLRKTLVKIQEIGSRDETLNLLKANMKGRFVKVLLLCDDGNKITSQEKRIFVLKHIVGQLNEGDVVNGLLVQTGTREKRKGSMLIGQIGNKVKPDEIHVIASLILSKMLQNIEDFSSPTKVATTNKLEFETSNLFQSNSEFFDYILQWRKDIPKKISKAIGSLFPTFLESDGDIYHLSPTIITFISTLSPKILQDKKFLLLIVKLFDTMKINSNFWGRSAMSKLRLSDNYEEIQLNYSAFANTMLNIAPRLINRIVYSRALSQHYTHFS
ncbi:MAG: hypothetical protein IIA83_00440 [Thaumarchaeota archaeon]|nr:hypothetical protein [Nitrososphaerota archaeon]